MSQYIFKAMPYLFNMYIKKKSTVTRFQRFRY